MQWYLMYEGKSAGPVDGEEIFKRGRDGHLYPSMYVRDEGGAWMPIAQSPFASVVSAPASPIELPEAPPKPSVRRIGTAVLAGVVVIAGLLVVVAVLFANAAPPPPEPTAVTHSEPVEAAEPTPPSVAERLVKVSTLSDAIRLTRPTMGDVRGEGTSPGAASLAVWWTSHPRLWDELIAMPDSKRAEVMKDPEPYRGQRICVTGSVVQIYRDKTVSMPIYEGVLMHSYSGPVRFLAVQSTAGIVENTPARFCGIVIGLQSYDNVARGTTHAIQVVGLFDIPANGGKGLPQEEW